MKKNTKTVITFEARQRTIVRPGVDRIFAQCGFCLTETAMFSPVEFARLLGLTPRQVYRRIEVGAFHFVEEIDGGLLICGNSSRDQIKGE
jgi:hypothetical protein